uniref:acyl-CoA hydrolase n=2 Tax=Physcomitrium patens TaxID=3218 RepID=A0A7I4B124_PHYPA|nr:uncharacterized protein LOC112291894 isoform X2 [Physcomitrium patens]|eukprot:XP_024395621.1 uncharacterized protein LOC112291894 isoform X2 [Physcomitrella patens]
MLIIETTGATVRRTGRSTDCHLDFKLRLVHASSTNRTNPSMAEARTESWTGKRIVVSPVEVTNFLGSIPLLQQLPGTSIQKIAEVVEPLQFGKGEVLLREGTPEDGLYFLWKGEVEVSIPNSMGSHTLGLLKSGDYFGYASAELIKNLNKSDVTAISEVICFVLRNENAHLLSSVSIWAQQPDESEVALLERILELETLEVDLYKGYTKPDYPSFGGNVYGGQLLGQALAAASKSVDPALLVHSLHAYFLLTGDERMPIIYKVERTRNGHTFATRQVSAIQKGRVIFTMYASFQRSMEGFEHQESMPNVPTPDQLLSQDELRKRYFSDPRIPLKKREKWAGGKPTKSSPLDVKEVDPIDEVSKEALPPWQSVWMKSKGKLTDDPALHRCAAVYASDWTFLATAKRPHRTVPIQLLSLDHSMWFHKPFRADEWLLFVQSSPRASNGRGSVYGHFFNQNGELVMSASQEGLMRKLQKSDRSVAKSKL